MATVTVSSIGKISFLQRLLRGQALVALVALVAVAENIVE